MPSPATNDDEPSADLPGLAGTISQRQSLNHETHVPRKGEGEGYGLGSASELG
jgi:hypothetical protein